MIKLIFSQLALISMSEQDLEYLKEHRDLFCVIPIDISYDGQKIELDQFTQNSSELLSKFYGVAQTAITRKFKVSLPSTKKLRNLLNIMRLEENDSLIYLAPSKIILPNAFDAIKDDIVSWGIKHGIKVNYINMHSISNLYAERIKFAVEYLANHFNTSTHQIYSEIKSAQRDNRAIQYLYIPDRKNAFDENMRNQIEDRFFGWFNFADHRSFLSVIDTESYDGRSMCINPTAEKITSIIRRSDWRLRNQSSHLVVNIYESDKNALSEIHDELNKTCSDTNIVYNKSLSLDPVTTICAGYGAILFEIRKV